MNVKKKMAIALVTILALSIFTAVVPAMAKDKKDQSVSQLDDIVQGETTPVISNAESALTGTWVNVDPKARGMVKFEIGNGQFHGYGSCSPTPCDWGNTPLTLYSKSITDLKDVAGTANYNFGFKDAKIFVQLVNKNTIKAYDFSAFKDGSGRHNYFEGPLTFKIVKAKY